MYMLTLTAAQIGDGTATLIKPKDPGVLGMGIKVLKEEGGLRALYKGIGPTTAGVMPYVAFNFVGTFQLSRASNPLTLSLDLLRAAQDLFHRKSKLSQ